MVHPKKVTLLAPVGYTCGACNQQNTATHEMSRAVQNQGGIDSVDWHAKKDRVRCSVHSVQSESVMNPSDKGTHMSTYSCMHAHGVACRIGGYANL